LTDSIRGGVPTPLIEVITLWRTLTRRVDDALAFFDRPSTSHGPTEAIKSRLEYPRGRALGFRALSNSIAHILLKSGGFRPLLHPGLR
jgi:transposase